MSENNVIKDGDKNRCFGGENEIYVEYHDREWGRPVHDDNKLFEMLVLEGMQAGLSWITILNKREAFREAFDDFNPKKVALYKDNKVEKLMANKDIIRSRMKIKAAINNAKVFLEVVKKYGSFDKMIWSYVDNKPIVGNWKTIRNIPSETLLSDKISRDLKKMGFTFVGSTTVYSFMQATGMVNDHMKTCFCYDEIVNAGNEGSEQ